MKRGDVFENLLDGAQYVVKNIVNNMVILGSRDSDRQILTGINTLRMKSLYRQIEKERKPSNEARNKERQV